MYNWHNSNNHGHNTDNYFLIFLAKTFMHTICKLQREETVYRFKAKTFISLCRNETTRLITRMIWPIQPVFHNNISRFMYFPQQRLLQCFLFGIRSHICLLNNTTNTRRRTRSTLPSTECRIFGTFNPFRTFFIHPYMNRWPLFSIY